MIYILYGLQELMIKNRIKKILAEFFNNEDENTIKIDLKDKTIGNLIDEISQFNLLNPKKAIVVSNSDFLSKNFDAKSKDKELIELFDCVNELDDNICLIFATNIEALSKKNQFVALASEIGKIFEFKNLTKNDWPIFVNGYFAKRNIKITPEAVNELVLRSKGNLDTFMNEANKLIMYKGLEGIDLNDIYAISSKSLDDNVFDILNNLLIGNKAQAIKTYRDVRIQGVEPVVLISLISSNLIFMLNVSNFLKEGKKADEIAKLTNSSSGRIFMTCKNLKTISQDQLINTLNKLFELDKAIKHNEIDRFYGFELFLSNF